MRRPIALWLVTSLLACGCAAGLTAPAASASGTGVTLSTPATGSTGTATQPTFNLNSAAQDALSPATTVASSGTSTTSSSGGLSSLDGVIIAAVAGVLLVGIAFLVRSDARRHLAEFAHGGRDDAMFGHRAHPGSKAPKKPRKFKPAERKRRKRGRAH
jgi:type IV secretory pathway TrbL component